MTGWASCVNIKLQLLLNRKIIDNRSKGIGRFELRCIWWTILWQKEAWVRPKENL